MLLAAGIYYAHTYYTRCSPDGAWTFVDFGFSDFGSEVERLCIRLSMPYVRLGSACVWKIFKAKDVSYKNLFCALFSECSTFDLLQFGVNANIEYAEGSKSYSMTFALARFSSPRFISSFAECCVDRTGFCNIGSFILSQSVSQSCCARTYSFALVVREKFK